MKKFLLLLLVFTLVFSITLSLTSCWGKKNTDKNDDDKDTPGSGKTDIEDETIIDFGGNTTENGAVLPVIPLPSEGDGQ